MKLEEAIALYKTVGHRNAGLFRWMQHIYMNVHLPCIDMDLKEKLANDKTKLAIFDVLADDLADNYEMRDEKLLKQFIEIPWMDNKRGGIHNKYLDAGKKIWMSGITSLKAYPRFDEFEKIFYFDLRQTLFSMEYSFLVNTKNIDNEIEDKIHLPNTTMVVVYCDMDLMCSKNFDLNELSTMRAIFHLAQRIAHLGNLINTYPREIEERDFSNPIISLAIRRGLIKRDNSGKDVLPKIKSLEKKYHIEAETCI